MNMGGWILGGFLGLVFSLKADRSFGVAEPERLRSQQADLFQLRALLQLLSQRRHAQTEFRSR